MMQASNRPNNHPQRLPQQYTQAQVAQNQPRRESRGRRIMQHPFARIATRVAPAMLAGGVIGAQVGGIMDQWSGADPVPMAGGGGGAGLGAAMFMSSGDDGDDGGYEELSYEEDYFAEQDDYEIEDVGWEEDAYGAGGTGLEEDVYGGGRADWEANAYEVQYDKYQDTDAAPYHSTTIESNQIQDGTGAQSSGFIEDDSTYSSMMDNGGYNIQY